ncbi:MAG TPA: sulfatase-like hydrolase/transferase [Thermoanaerobaculia bacterium]|nr:sulfatase-like hydrolase/transferase [Thermoanaerobaculia bacterium]
MLLAVCAGALLLSSPAAARRFPSVLVITVDTLRADHLSAYGYPRPTSPNIDALLGAGARFRQARTPEPLTMPALASLITSLHPHEHGASRNGLPLRPGLPSVASVLGRRGFRTAAFVGNWTLVDKLSGLGEHFQTYEEVLNRKRWYVIKGEATADDLTDTAVTWVDEHVARHGSRPFLLWAHYVDPHAPYRFHQELAPAIGVRGPNPGPIDRYDTEIAFVDRAIGRLLAAVRRASPPGDTVIVFAADHGESLGERRYWGHGRHLDEPCLRVPMGLAWSGRVAPQVVAAPASLIDLAPTVLGLMGYPVPSSFRGFDWSGVLVRGEEAPSDRATFHQAHKGAVQGVENPRRARRRGLLEVGLVREGRKEVLRLRGEVRLLFDVTDDIAEDGRALAASASPPSPLLLRWRRTVEEGLRSADDLPPAVVDAETEEQMRALGYLD